MSDNIEVQKFIRDRERAYRAVFNNELAKLVLADLRVFCGATKSSFNSCPYEMARNEGRREVFNRIMNYLEVDYSDYYNYTEEEYD
jgi:hypothetical protein